MWIRYGKPNRIIEYHENNIDIDKIGAKGIERGLSTNFKFQFWYYEDFAFVFRTKIQDLANNFGLKNWKGLNFKELEPVIVKEYPDFYEYKPHGIMFNFFVDLVRFRGKNNDNDVKLYYGFPLNFFQMERETDIWKGRLQHGVFLFDKEWKPYASLRKLAKKNGKQDVCHF